MLQSQSLKNHENNINSNPSKKRKGNRWESWKAATQFS